MRGQGLENHLCGTMHLMDEDSRPRDAGDLHKATLHQN